MDKELILKKTASYVKETLAADSSGHDWWHVYRVWKNAINIGRHEADVDLFVVELAALLHDIADFKLYDATKLLVQKWPENGWRS